ncbi:hypothetical protein [Bacillus mesophilum]|uniref:Uncharacterized protein n=1 Tax=Bacillus mesophilum TaxID=1071718 RepID=A0A7V7RQI6_9BACI|nr:hypothetical protein [Bacillus mesophilum]KAB2335727.1 hypothetical protein F7732_03945 [Bacillus mesophilum]
MTEKHPDFMKSSYFVDEPGNWHMKAGAPKELREQLEQYLQSLEEPNNEPGTIYGIHIDYPY